MPTILVIDDDVEFLNAMSDMLVKRGYEVMRAADGPEAMGLLEQHREGIALAIVDLALPGVNGFELIGAVARRPNSIKLIATTGVYRDTQLEVAGALGAHAVIRKPLPGSAIPVPVWLAAVRKLIGPPEGGKFARAATVQETENGSEPSNGKRPS
jgi:CheY-like chemotaxis protein